MGVVMTADEFIDKLKEVAKMKTVYVLGGFGIVLNQTGKRQSIAQYPYNAQPMRKNIINAVSDDTFGFDCSGLIKGILWGFGGDTTQVYGGARYASMGVTDCNTKGILQRCSDVSNDFTKVIPGEYLYMDGHCGVYIGDNNVIECTPSWDDGVQKTSMSARVWLSHGKLPWIEYNDSSVGKTDMVDKILDALTEVTYSLSEIKENLNSIRGTLW